ncbi:hypothetical protein [Polyangium sorediatum]|uniref:Tetratricopeptide repeat protein n=1 Tax=Polyangium sorediatum TaxID=889274 RepID=A0ABT6P8B1_9BACT|nr:hypothetical protein [Polyangium sorediatum]MDI1436794.1 hypothetical protein [Polyangium sorediatum]
MSRPLALIALALLSLSAPVTAAEPNTPAPPQPEESKGGKVERFGKVTPEDEARFNALVASGDRALDAGRLNDAVIAYLDALDIKFDARLSGRVGLVLSMFQQSPSLDIKIARLLVDAVDDAAGISTAERRQFFDAYERVRKRLCRLEVTLNYVDATVSIGSRKPLRSDGAFWTFIPPGKTDIVASLPGRDDIKQVADCVPGKGALMEFEFPPLPGEERETIVRAPPERVIIRDEFPVYALRTPEPAIKKDDTPRSRFAGGIGPVLVIGAAPSPSLGVSITGEYRLQGWSAVGIAKGAWSMGDVEKRPIDIFSASATVGPCVQWQWLDGCAFGGAIVFEQRMKQNDLYHLRTNTKIIPALGLGIGATYAIKDRLSARVFVDATALTQDLIVGIVPSGGAPISVWQTQRFLFSVSALLMFGR